MHGIQLKLDWIPLTHYKLLEPSGMQTFRPFCWFYLVGLMQIKYDNFQNNEILRKENHFISWKRLRALHCNEKLTYVNISV
jgi:hypothetical protein